jgi:hypothetical protein
MLKKSMDLKYGLSKESFILQKIKEYWINENILNTKELYNDQYYIYDFESENNIYELKSRRTKKNHYSTTIIPESKIIKSIKDYYFIFNFTDYISFIKYDIDLFNTFNKKYIFLLRDNKKEYKLHFEIPINLLIDLYKYEI